MRFHFLDGFKRVFHWWFNSFKKWLSKGYGLCCGFKGFFSGIQGLGLSAISDSD
jgi:hypothetical protein